MTRALCALLLVSLAPSPALAYLDGARFVDPVMGGGAGGRFFTGAPGDGYGCVVCHSGGAAAEVTVEGVPDTWEPSRTYDLALVFPDGTRSAGATLEVADEMGEQVGDLDVVPMADLDAADRCRDDTPAVSLAPITGRLVARADVCGALRARVRWTAPAAPVTGVRFFASAVFGDDSGDPTGDATVTLVRPLRALGAPALEGGRLAQRCSVTPGAGRGVFFWAIAAAALALSRRR